MEIDTHLPDSSAKKQPEVTDKDFFNIEPSKGTTHNALKHISLAYFNITPRNPEMDKALRARVIVESCQKEVNAFIPIKAIQLSPQIEVRSCFPFSCKIPVRIWCQAINGRDEEVISSLNALIKATPDKVSTINSTDQFHRTLLFYAAYKCNRISSPI
jgi:hypothetical protein